MELPDSILISLLDDFEIDGKIINSNEPLKTLKLIKDRIPFWYSNVEYSISRIFQNDITFLYPYEDISYFVSDEISSSDLILYASPLHTPWLSRCTKCDYPPKRSAPQGLSRGTRHLSNMPSCAWRDTPRGHSSTPRSAHIPHG